MEATIEHQIGSNKELVIEETKGCVSKSSSAAGTKINDSGSLTPKQPQTRLAIRQQDKGTTASKQAKLVTSGPRDQQQQIAAGTPTPSLEQAAEIPIGMSARVQIDNRLQLDHQRLILQSFFNGPHHQQHQMMTSPQQMSSSFIEEAQRQFQNQPKLHPQQQNQLLGFSQRNQSSGSFLHRLVAAAPKNTAATIINNNNSQSLVPLVNAPSRMDPHLMLGRQMNGPASAACLASCIPHFPSQADCSAVQDHDYQNRHSNNSIRFQYFGPHSALQEQEQQQHNQLIANTELGQAIQLHWTPPDSVRLRRPDTRQEAIVSPLELTTPPTGARLPVINSGCQAPGNLGNSAHQDSGEHSESPAQQQLYLLLERANLLQYFGIFLEFGGDDVQQLSEADEEEFLEIMNLVGMTRKPLHVRRLQRALIEWRRSTKCNNQQNEYTQPANG